MNSPIHDVDPPKVDDEHLSILKERQLSAFQKEPGESDASFYGRIEVLLGINKVLPIDAFFNHGHSPSELRVKRDQLREIVSLLNSLLMSAQREEPDENAHVNRLNGYDAEYLYRHRNSSQQISEIPANLLLGNTIQLLAEWIGSVKYFAVKEYARYLELFLEEIRIPSDETVEGFNEKLKDRGYINKIFPQRQFGCHVTGMGTFCATCSTKRCKNCCFEINPCQLCEEAPDKNEAKKILDLITGGKPCNKNDPLKINVINKTERSDFKNGRILHTGRQRSLRSTIPVPQLIEYATCSQTIKIPALGESYTYQDPSGARAGQEYLQYMEFEELNLYSCMHHALFHSASINDPTDYGSL
jgi:hypothetical protein